MPKILLIALCLLISQLHLISATLVELTLKEPYNGQRKITGEKVSMSKDETTLKVEGKYITIPRNNITLFKFPPQKKQHSQTTTSNIGLDNQTVAYRGDGSSITLKEKKQSAAKNADPKDLDKPQNREEFKKIQAQMMAKYKGRAGYAEAIAMQNSMYEALASGQMSVEELQAKAKSVSEKAKGYSAKETAEYPELQSLLKVLDNFSNE